MSSFFLLFIHSALISGMLIEAFQLMRIQESYRASRNMKKEDRRIAELEEIGGDPFFLFEEDEGDGIVISEEGSDEAASIITNLSAEDQLLFVSTAATAASSSEALVQRYATDGLGPSKNNLDGGDSNGADRTGDETFEWDGIVDENAHLD
jgi:hypothetical protein